MLPSIYLSSKIAKQYWTHNKIKLRRFSKVYMFCKNPYKMSASGFQKLTAVMAPSLEEEINAMIQSDDNLWLEYGEIDFVVKEVFYHKECQK